MKQVGELIVLTPAGCRFLIRGDLRARQLGQALRHTGWLASVLWRDLREHLGIR